MDSPRKVHPAGDEDSDESVCWEDLHDTIDFCRRQSMETSKVSMDSRNLSSSNNNMSVVSMGSASSVYRDADDDLRPTRSRIRTSYNTRAQMNQPSMDVNNLSRLGGASWENLGVEIERAKRESLTGEAIDEGEGDSASSADQEEGPWSCVACTFLNENPLHLVCGVCGTAKAARREIQPTPARLQSSGNITAQSYSKKPPAAAKPVSGPDRARTGDNSALVRETGSGHHIPRRQVSGKTLASHLHSASHSRGSARLKSTGDSSSSSHSTEVGKTPSGYCGVQDLGGISKPSFKSDAQDLDGNGHVTQSAKSSEMKLGNGETISGSSFRSTDSVNQQIVTTIENQLGGIQDELESSIRSNDNAQSYDDLRSSLLDLQYKVDDLKSSFKKEQVDDDHMHSVKPSDKVEVLRGSIKSIGKLEDLRDSQISSATAVEAEFGDSIRSLKETRHQSNNTFKGRRRPSTGSVDDASVTSGSSGKKMGRLSSQESDGGYAKASKSSLRGSKSSYRRSSVEFDVHVRDDDSYMSESIDQSFKSYSDDDDRTTRTMQTIKSLRVPEKEATIIYTDVQGSTALWEAVPLSMKKATDLHDSIIRKCYADHGGYEISTEGDSFNLAFQHPADAIGFALKAQLTLYRANWSEDILNHEDGNFNEKKAFRGFRVRMGMHHGPVQSSVHETTGRTIYRGEAVNIAKSIEKMSHGGQILTTVETWRAVSGMAEQHLGKPQVMDCGEHLLWDPKKNDKSQTSKSKAAPKMRYQSKRILQLVPKELSYDFFAARGGQEVKEGETPKRVCGRVFPPLLSHGQLSTSFLNAPFKKNRVAMVFVYTDKMELIFDNERKRNQKYLAKYIRKHLMQLSPPGYECQEDKGSWMIAFDRTENGIKFALELKETVIKSPKLRGDIDREKIFKIGIHWGPFLSMGPHTITGHADYFGPIGETNVGVEFFFILHDSSTPFLFS